MAIIKGTNKANVLNDTARDDTLMGLGGNDTLISDSGNDILMGGPGNDTYKVIGRAGDHLHIVDPGVGALGGTDTLDFTGASTAAVINLKPGATSTVDGREIELSSEISVGKLDIAVLQDLSGSFSDDCTTMDTIAPKLASALLAASVDTQFGVASFIDKPVSPFGSTGDYVYRTDLEMTSDSVAFIDTVTNLSTGSGYDYREAQIEALMHLSETEADFGFRDDSYKVVVLATDADYHRAGDDTADPANNGDGVIDTEDYPDVAQLSASLEESGIIPIFAVTSDVISIYQDLVDQLGVGAVVELSSDSANLVKAVKGGLGDLFSSNIENAIGTRFADTIKGNDFANLLDGAAGNDKMDGGKGNDTLLGGDGNDKLTGGSGKDDLNGGLNNDKLSGGAKADTFHFGNDAGTATAWGRDTITDFVAGSDKVDMSGMKGVADFGDLTVGVNAAGDATVTFNGSTITFTHVASVDAGDFIFA